LPSLLARFAENSFWLARYVERAENLARLLDVNLAFAADSEDVSSWLPVVQLFDDGERFFSVHEHATAASVLHWYVLDAGNPTSIIADLAAARENARTLRHLISTEAWTQLNVVYNRLRALRPQDLALDRLDRLCVSIKEDCQLHTGIVEGTLYRDQTWHFYTLGRWMERADQTTRLLDINHHHLHTALAGAPAAEVRHWQALLRSLAGFHAFRRIHTRGLQPVRVVDFLLFDRAFPRSVAACVGEIGDLVERLLALPDLARVAMPRRRLEQLRAHLEVPDVEDMATLRLHEFLDGIQTLLMAFTDDLARTFFRHEPSDDHPAQRQSQDDLPLPPAGDVQRTSGDHPAPRQP
jgi:uncharacterized alpha-E superfamily protein